MGRFPLYVPQVDEKETSIEDLMEKIRANQTSIAAYSSISGNGYRSLVPENNASLVLGTNIAFLEQAVIMEFEGSMKLSKAYPVQHKK